MGSVLEELLAFSVRVRWMEQHMSNYPGCGIFYMLDLDKKVGNKVCANTRGEGEKIVLENKENKEKPCYQH